MCHKTNENVTTDILAAFHWIFNLFCSLTGFLLLHICIMHICFKKISCTVNVFMIKGNFSGYDMSNNKM